jgi:hypothetical protein
MISRPRAGNRSMAVRGRSITILRIGRLSNSI